MGKPLSWKWKLTIAFIALFLGLLAFIFSGSGQEWMAGKIVESVQSLPESERRDSPWADRWMLLAWWRANILMDSQGAMDMYREFCGLPKNPLDESVFKYPGKLCGPLCSEDGKTGWGPFHKRAPEAYAAFLEIFDEDHSSMATREQALNYYRLFYTWEVRHASDHKPHPYFNKYWPKMKDYVAKVSLPWGDIDPRAPMAPPAPKDDE